MASRGKKKCEACLQHVDCLMIAAHCFLFVRVSEESSRCPFETERQQEKKSRKKKLLLCQTEQRLILMSPSQSSCWCAILPHIKTGRTMSGPPPTSRPAGLRVTCLHWVLRQRQKDRQTDRGRKEASESSVQNRSARFSLTMMSGVFIEERDLFLL